MLKIELLENKLLALFEEFEKENPEIFIQYKSNYDMGKNLYEST
jgi:hypothetical protein